ncbi:MULTISPECIES: DRTGG domain-containing protein [unclassified Paenibacillus]|uniref:DRTGG domain-containing protein n=1 Tax=unclassified Paenibacillus TaxID=185978 RepID=UPI001AE5D610|nr:MULTISPECIES: DRTGG domain-containing protein [unclassified Paenibacillus]MBP1156443.1 putative transcriptional regulator [Paenibacillus sp. PvP091]MBP1168171.1 putative transcriptional regulator [Paenibacillus sp. PvR098]MBP2439199.1 putative transcriptional regulator [Paenibacillus sp. PvP052]
MSLDNSELNTKHEQITKYIESLSVGTKLSVRKIAQELEVSEGTAYRAIKEAENTGLVSTKRRIGTIRVEKKEELQIDKLTFAEIVMVVEGVVLGGSAGIHKTLNKFVIGAMQLEAMLKYIEQGNLLIVGNRVQAHMCALSQGSGVLITGGFDTTPEVKKLADDLELPIIGSSYDTFTVAAMINRAIEDRLIKKQILIVEDIIRKDTPVYSLLPTNTVKDMEKLVEQTSHTRYPVVDEDRKPIGIITTKDIIGAKPNQPIGELMTLNPLVISTKTSVASAGHTMVWEGIELLPVIDSDRKMIGVISRKDVMKAMQYMQKQPQNAETFEVQISAGFEELRNAEGKLYFKGSVTPQMTNYEGMVSEGVLSTLMIRAAYRTVQEHKKGDLIIDSSSSYFLVALQIDDVIEIVPTIIELSRRFCKIDLEMTCNGVRVARSMVTARILQ